MGFFRVAELAERGFDLRIVGEAFRKSLDGGQRTRDFIGAEVAFRPVPNRQRGGEGLGGSSGLLLDLEQRLLRLLAGPFRLRKSLSRMDIANGQRHNEANKTDDRTNRA